MRDRVLRRLVAVLIAVPAALLLALGLLSLGAMMSA